jgi:transposase-like protein
MPKRHVRCQYCRSLETKRNGKRKIGRGSIQRFRCLSCCKYFTCVQEPHQRVTKRQQVKITETHLEGRTSIRTLARQTGHSTKTILNAIHTITSQCISAAWIATHLKPEWSGFLALDGKIIRVWDWSAKHFHYTKAERRWLHKMTLLLALDLGTLDLPCHHFGDDETVIDLTMFLTSLKEMGYPLKGYVSDGNQDIPRAVIKVFGAGIPHQLCTTHYLRNLRTKYRGGLITKEVYQDVKTALTHGKRPKLMVVPETLFTYQKVPQLPHTNQQMENCIRFLNLRLKTIGQFGNWQHASNYCDALVAMRRFTKFTDRKNGENGRAPLELAGCNIRKLKYLRLGLKSSR